MRGPIARSVPTQDRTTQKKSAVNLSSGIRTHDPVYKRFKIIRPLDRAATGIGTIFTVATEQEQIALLILLLCAI